MTMKLVQQMEKTRVSSGQLVLWVLGGGSLAFKSTGMFGFVDPFFSDWSDSEWVRRFPPVLDPNTVRTCDMILITHEHEDHCDPVTIKGLCSKHSLDLLAPGPSVERLEASGIFSDLPQQHIELVKPGKELQVEDLRITAVQTRDPLSHGAVGYLVQTATVRVLFLGDSLFDEELLRSLVQGHDIDAMFIAVGANPLGERYYFSIEELVEAARIVSPTLVVPIHWDLWTKTYVNPESLLPQERGNIAIIKRGEMLVLP